jgi:NAD(P)-dependent dehydrogenase (short-subunit alcohol dehydrogenase family)
MTSLSGKNAVIIGGETGIGRAISRTLVERGASVVIAGILDPEGEELAEELSRAGSAKFIKIDVRDEAQVGAAVSATSGPIDILIYSAGIFDAMLPTLGTTNDVWDQVMNINLRGAFWASRAALEIMVPRGYGKIVNIGSVASRIANADGAAYTISKHGMLGLTRHIAYTYSKDGINANIICPGIIETTITANSARIWGEGAPKMDIIDGSDGWKPLVPAKRKGQPTDVAELAAFLASDESGYITGQSVGIDGGWVM